MANLLSMYNTQEKDYARDLRDLLAGLNRGKQFHYRRT